MKRTLYEVIGVDPEASTEEIAAAYRKRLEELNAAPSQDLSAIALAREARDILSDKHQRGAYDASLAPPLVRESAPPEEEPVETSEPWWRERKWQIAAAVIFILVAWLIVQRTGSRAPKRPANSITVETTPQAAPEEAAGAQPPTRSAKDVFNDVSPSVVRINVMDSSSRLIDSVSGVVIEPALVITNCHVAARGAALGVEMGSQVRAASLQVADELLDLCRLSVPGLEVPAVPMGSASSLRAGQRVVAIGAPAGPEASMKDGIITALPEVGQGTVIQTNAAISPRWSGGGLFDLSGRLIGITTYYHRYGQSVNVALPADWIQQMQTRGAAAPANAQAVPVADNQDIPANLISGRWWCFGSIAGRNGDYTFRDDGRVLVTTSEGRPFDTRYVVSKRSLRFESGAQNVTFNIESFSPQKMVWQLGGEGGRVVCDRR